MTEQSEHNRRSDMRWRWFLIFSFSPRCYATNTDPHAWAARHLTLMSKALVDDAVKMLTRDRGIGSMTKKAEAKAGLWGVGDLRWWQLIQYLC